MKAPDDLLGQLGGHAARGQDPRACVQVPEVDPGLLLALRHGKLDATDAEKIREHLVECTHCRRFVGDLRPATRKELRHWQGKRGLRPAQWMSIAALLVAGVSAWLLYPAVTPPPGYAAEQVLGGVKLNKSATPQTDTFFLPESRLSWLIRPAQRVQTPPAARAFVVEGDRLAALPEGALALQDGGAWLLESPAKAVLGQTYGERALVVAVSFDADALKALDGTRWDSDRDSKTVKYYSRTIRYRATMEGLE